MAMPLIPDCGFARKSCYEIIKRDLAGTWTIIRMNASFVNSVTGMAKTIVFNENGTCMLPELDIIYNREASWTVDAKDMTLHIRCYSATNPFHGVFSIYFLHDEREKTLKISLVSLSVELICTR